MAETGTALSVVEAQQDIVGGTLVGATGAGVLAETPSDSTSQILEQIRDIQTQTLRAVRSVADGIMQMVDIQKLQDRRALEDKTENEKEANLGAVPGAVPGAAADPGDVDKQTGGFFGFLGAIPGAGFFKKLLLPITAFFGKSGLLVKLFGRFGPLGALILGFTLVYKYSDEIAKALTPALDKLKELIVALEPLFEFLKKLGDFLIKTLLENLGGLLENVIDSIMRVVDGFKMLFEGDILGGLNEIFGGIFDFVLAFPKAILDTITDIISPLATAVGDFFTQLYNDVVKYVSDTIENIKTFFIDLTNNILTFFTDAYNTVKKTITDAVQGAFDFIADIFNSISDFMSEAYTKAKNFVTSLPDRILGFISNMFSPIIDFFNSIGNRIKTTINGVIDALPLPDFVKDKIKFNVEPTQDQLDSESEKSFEKLEAPDVTSNNKNMEFFALLDKHKDDINKFMKETGYKFDYTGSKFQFEEGAGKYFSFDKGGQSYMANADDFNADEAINFIKSGQTMSFKDVETAPAESITTAKEIGTTENTSETMIVNNNNYNTSNSSVNNQTDVHSGKLDTGIDTYFDKVAFNARGYS